MFESKEELDVVKAFDEHFPTIAKEMIATAIQAGCIICQDVISNACAMGIPKSKMFNQACSLGFIINKILTESIDSSNTPTMTYEEDTVGHGRPIVHFNAGGFCLHIKKNQSPRRLPKGSKFRREETYVNQQLTLEFFDSSQKPIYLIVTYNHRNFHLQYVQIGIANSDYTGWLHRWNLVNYIQPERAEVIRNEYGAAIRENAERIAKTYRLEMRGNQ